MPGKDSNKKYLTKLRPNINVTFCATYGLGKRRILIRSALVALLRRRWLLQAIAANMTAIIGV
jgi:hypothetical protein